MRSRLLASTFTQAFLVAMLVAAPAAAQTSLGREPAPRIDVSGGLNFGIGGPRFLDAGARLRLTRVVDAGLTLGWLGHAGPYVVDVRWTPRGVAHRIQPFVSSGMGGFVRFASKGGVSHVLATTGDTLVYAPYRYLEVSEPLAFVAGGGVRIPVTTRIALEGAAQAWLGSSPLVVATIRLSVGVGKVRP